MPVVNCVFTAPVILPKQIECLLKVAILGKIPVLCYRPVRVENIFQIKVFSRVKIFIICIPGADNLIDHQYPLRRKSFSERISLIINHQYANHCLLTYP